MSGISVHKLIFTLKKKKKKHRQKMKGQTFSQNLCKLGKKPPPPPPVVSPSFTSLWTQIKTPLTCFSSGYLVQHGWVCNLMLCLPCNKLGHFILQSISLKLEKFQHLFRTNCVVLPKIFSVLDMYLLL